MGLANKSGIAEKLSALVLYVDDEPQALKYFRKTVGRCVEVVTCATPERAIELLEERQNEFGVVVADDRMPRTSGMAFLGSVAKRWPNATRILTTAYADVERLCDSINSNTVDRIILKPWNSNELCQAVKKAVILSRIRRGRIVADKELSDQINLLSQRLLRADLLATSVHQVASSEVPTSSLYRMLRLEIARARECLQLFSEGLAPDAGLRPRGLCAISECLKNAILLVAKTDSERDLISTKDVHEFHFLANQMSIERSFAELIASSLRTIKTVEKPSIKISTHRQGAFWKVTIEDNGDWTGVSQLLEMCEMAIDGAGRLSWGLSASDWFLRAEGASLTFEPSTCPGMNVVVTIPIVLR